jgi:hypothetical protein
MTLPLLDQTDALPEETPVSDTFTVPAEAPAPQTGDPDGIPGIIYPTKTVLGDGSVLVDAATATEWLKANSHNRRLRNGRVDQMSRDMIKGNWDDNGETIKFSRTGVLLDGQHRLSAVIQSDTVQVFTVIAGLEDKVRRSVDTGGKRTVGDQLTLHGRDNGTTLASVARFAMQMQAYPRTFVPTDIELTEIAENDEKLQWVVNNVTPKLPAILGSPTLRSYVYRVLHEVDPDACATFFSKLTTLDKLPQDSPILALYRRLANPDTRKDGFKGRVAQVTCYFIAWNAWRAGESRQIIKPHTNAEGYVMPPKPV